MTEYPEMVKEAAEARIGADRMAIGLPCIPDPLRGDMAEIDRLKAENDQFRRTLEIIAEKSTDQLQRMQAIGALANIGRAMENKP